jgi:hypothetical protein
MRLRVKSGDVGTPLMRSAVHSMISSRLGLDRDLFGLSVCPWDDTQVMITAGGDMGLCG